MAGATSPQDKFMPYAVLLMSLAAAFYLLAYRPWSVPFKGDSTHYFFMAERIASGRPVLAEHFDPKTTLSLFADAALMALGRQFVEAAEQWRADVAAARAMALFWWLLTIYGSARLAFLLSRNRAVTIFTVLILWTLHPVWASVNMGAEPKLATMAFIPFAILFTSQKRWFSAGLLSACVFLTWQPTALLFLSITIVLICNKGWSSLIKYTCGFALMVVPYELYYLITGQFLLHVEAQLLFPLFKMSGETATGINLADLPAFWHYTLSYRNPYPLLFILGIVVGGFRTGFRIQKRRSTVSTPALQKYVIYHLAYGSLFAFTLVDAQGAADYFVTAPYMAISGAWFLVFFVREVRIRIARNLGTLPLWGAAIYLLFIIIQGPLRSQQTITVQDQLVMARKLEAVFEQEGETLYIIGATHLLALTNQSNWLRYGFIFRGMNSFLNESASTGRWTPEINRALPDNLIILSRKPVPGLESWISPFERVSMPHMDLHQLEWYRLRSPPD